jgi:hypothetical protein
MAYKRTSRKTGKTTRRTHTINTNGSITDSSSQGTKNFRTTYSNNTKTGSKVTQTYRDGAGFVHTRVLSKTKSAAALEREHKREQKLWRDAFGSKKKKTTIGNHLAVWIVIFVLFIYLVSR